MIMSFAGAVRGKNSSLSVKTPIVGPESFGPLAWPIWRDFSQLAQTYAQELFGFPIDVLAVIDKKPPRAPYEDHLFWVPRRFAQKGRQPRRRRLRATDGPFSVVGFSGSRRPT